jgi:hypothetical protein
MALMSPQAVSSVITPSFTAPTTSDTITYQAGQWLHVIVGATSTTITVVVPGNQEYSGVAKTDNVVTSVTNTQRIFALPLEAVDPATGLITVTYSQVTNVTAGLFKI